MAKSRPAGPYHVEQLETPEGPEWHLAGPGLEGTKGYAWEEVREKLSEMAALMNFAWRQAKRSSSDSKD